MARDFNGTTQNITASSFPGSGGAAARSVTMWFKTPSPATRQFYYSEGGETANGRVCFDLASSVMTVNFFNAALASTTPVTSGVWYHACLTYTGSVLAIYVNGALENSTSIALNTAGSGFSIGSHHSGSSKVVGTIAEVAKYDVALGVAEIVALAKASSPLSVRPSSLIFYAPMVRNVFDYKAGLALTDNGPTTAAAHPRIYR